MEGLLKLEKLQKMMELMESHGLISSSDDDDPNSHLFLADFTLFLVQSCNKIDMETKGQLISSHLQKISMSFFEEAQKWVTEEGGKKIGNTLSLRRGDNLDIDSRKRTSQEASTVGLDAMQRANSTLEDFCRSYFMFHEMDVHQPKEIFKYLPILSFTESYIYQLDTLNEKLLQSPAYGGQLERESAMDCKKEQRREVSSLVLLKPDPFRPLVTLLEQEGLLTERIMEELRSGEEYWALERKLCSPPLSSPEITIGDVMRAVRMKSFDYRVLNLLLYQLRKEELFMFDYEDDVLENNFNVLRMFVRIYGASKAPMMLAKCIAEAEEKYENLLKSLDAELSMTYQKRCEEATKEGGKTVGPSLGTWNIPAIIQNEDSYRSQILKTNSSSVV
ncbi:OLC1v1009331C1 [Oldenlandia corymbosa var. corymbosa]|uniref:OLC1v1009331C1 n=1 Tax=Oldenlandia corymbosa var. corymbosa TaxID=529605 RepID=A0AAV1DR34_OLDCO|nr:OLC1v1009331C1 [Oldenlandia corymbosa var. corymbosa]